MSQHTGKQKVGNPRPAPKLSFGPVLLTRAADLQALAAGPASAALYPRDFEQLGQAFGYVLYETTIPASFSAKRNNTRPVLMAPSIRDRGIVFLDQVRDLAPTILHSWGSSRVNFFNQSRHWNRFPLGVNWAGRAVVTRGEWRCLAMP